MIARMEMDGRPSEVLHFHLHKISISTAHAYTGFLCHNARFHFHCKNCFE